MVWNKLTTRKIASLKKPGWYGDGGQLWLQVAPGGSKSWLFRFTIDGRARAMGLGSLHTVSLGEARDLARTARRQIFDGKDPIAERRATVAARRHREALRVTFDEAARRYIAAHASGWRSAVHRDQWQATIATYASPLIGDVVVDAIGVADVLRVLEPIWTNRTATASRLRGRIEKVLDWCTVRGFRAGDNPAKWRGHLDALLPSPRKVGAAAHLAAMPFAEVPGFVEELGRRSDVPAAALELLILTACRTGEVLGGQWSEINLAAKVWTIPASRTKGHREHRVPLSDRCLEVLAALPRAEGNPLLFPGHGGRPLTAIAALKVLRELRPGLTVHGFRSSFRDWAGEQTNFPREVAEAALGHRTGDATERAYRRGDALEKRRRLMEAWAKFCASPRSHSGGVVAMRRGRP